jgi:hypothetical protein
MGNNSAPGVPQRKAIATTVNVAQIIFATFYQFGTALDRCAQRFSKCWVTYLCLVRSNAKCRKLLTEAIRSGITAKQKPPRGKT